MIAIYKRELQSYFTSMIGCIFIAFFIAIVSLYFQIYNLLNGYTYFSYALYSTTFFLLIGVPLLSMKCFAEEKKNKTEQLLMTSPVSLTGIVVGKYLSMITVFAVPNLLFCTYPLIIKSLGTAHLLIDYATILSYFLLGCAFLAIGMYISSLTESQVIAAIATLAILYVLYIWDGLISYIPFTTLQSYLQKFSMIEVITNFALNQIFDVLGLILYMSIIFVFVFLTIQSLQKRRWS